MLRNGFNGKKVLVTGHTGFKGSWLSLWLNHLGASVTGLALPPKPHEELYRVISGHAFDNEFECDIRDAPKVASIVAETAPDIVFHLAAQPLVRQSYAEPVETFEVNAVGTANILEAVRNAALPCNVIVVTSDKCYENRNTETPYNETDALGGFDPYSMSKGAAELVATSWHRSFFGSSDALGKIATVRGGNVLGGGDYAADRIVPDAVRALSESKPILVRNPAATRPWQHVLDCLSGYLCLACRLENLEDDGSAHALSFNIGPGPDANHPVSAVVEEILNIWPGEWVDGSEPGAPHEASLLNLDISKAANVLDWKPVWSFKETIDQAIGWYKQRHCGDNPDMLEFSISQVDEYTAAAEKAGLSWTSASASSHA